MYSSGAEWRGTCTAWCRGTGAQPACVYSSGAVPAWSHGHLGTSEVMLSACLALVRCRPGAPGTCALEELRLSARYACLRRRRLTLLVALEEGKYSSDVAYWRKVIDLERIRVPRLLTHELAGKRLEAVWCGWRGLLGFAAISRQGPVGA